MTYFDGWASAFVNSAASKDGARRSSPMSVESTARTWAIWSEAKRTSVSRASSG